MLGSPEAVHAQRLLCSGCLDCHYPIQQVSGSKGGMANASKALKQHTGIQQQQRSQTLQAACIILLQASNPRFIDIMTQMSVMRACVAGSNTPCCEQYDASTTAAGVRIWQSRAERVR